MRLTVIRLPMPVSDHMSEVATRTSTRASVTWQKRLRLYFESGWAFLIPYLAAYLLYAWLRWPVNPGAGVEGVGTQGQNTGVFSSLIPAAAAHFRPPCLLHVYWTLHLIHLLLGCVALRSGWTRLAAFPATPTGPLASLSSFQKAIPWIFLALLFYLPGVYLEFPADPWQHYLRVNEWSWLQTVTEHSFWAKSSYFLAYSLVGRIALPVVQLRAFDVFYTGCCLLLCWQYYRLARALGFGARVAMSFVLLQALLFGNFIFGFYRYYGMSSSVFAQLGAVSLVRVALEACSNHPGADHREPFGGSTLHRALKLCVASALLVVLTAFNHIQGLGIAGLGVAAVIMWRLIQWRRSARWWLAGAAVLLSVAAVLWWPKHPALDASYRPSGWLTAWYGFNLLAPSSPAYSRAAAIIGLFGLFNLVAGLWLLRRNHVVGWLTVTPVVALCLPCFAIPFANSLAVRPVSDDIVVFSRMLFAIPSGLALVALMAGWAAQTVDSGVARLDTARGSAGFRRQPAVLRIKAACRPDAAPFAFLLLSLFALVVVPASGPCFNRLFNVLMVPPDDLAMRHIIQSPAIASLALKPRLAELIGHPEQVWRERGGILTTPGISYAMNATGATLIVGARKGLLLPPSFLTAARLENLRHVEPGLVSDAPFPARANLFSVLSQSAYLSNHWLPNDVALQHATQSELFAHGPGSVTSSHLPQIWLEWSDSRGTRMFSGRGARIPVGPGVPEERGRLDSGVDEQPLQVGDLLTFRPVMRTLEGNGWRVAFKVQGPGYESQQVFTGRPSPLGRESWITGNRQIRLRQPGHYTVELTGSVFWPSRTYVVRYYVDVPPE